MRFAICFAVGLMLIPFALPWQVGAILARRCAP